MADTNLFSTTPTNQAPKFNLGNMQSASTWNVDPKTQTVAGQLESVLSKDSPLMQQARTRATQGMQSRGLANSSMALGAADSAMYDKALQIATPDAATYADAAKTNMAANNQFGLQKNEFTQAGTMAEYGANSNNWMADQNANRNSALNTQQQGFDLAKMDKDVAGRLSLLDAQSKSDMLKLATSHNYDVENMTLQQVNDLEKMQADQQNVLQRLSVDQQNTLRKMAVQQDMSLEQMDAQQINDLAKIAFGSDVALNQLDAQTDAAKEIAALEADYKSTLQGSASAANIMTNMQTSLDRLYSRAKTDNLTAQNVKDMETAIFNNTKASMQIIGALAGDQDLGKYIDDLFA